MRFVVLNEVNKGDILHITMYLSDNEGQVNVKGKAVWVTKTSLEDSSPNDVGLEIIEIEEKKKNMLLKYLCDLFYNSAYIAR
jgi:Tfp pilus assembly protein PilZ